MKVPQPAKITGRSSSITNAFIQAIIPTKPWSSDEEAEALLILGMKRPDTYTARIAEGKRPSGITYSRSCETRSLRVSSTRSVILSLLVAGAIIRKVVPIGMCGLGA